MGWLHLSEPKGCQQFARRESSTLHNFADACPSISSRTHKTAQCLYRKGAPTVEVASNPPCGRLKGRQTTELGYLCASGPVFPVTWRRVGPRPRSEALGRT